jgi:hypothetical protein
MHVGGSQGGDIVRHGNLRPEPIAQDGALVMNTGREISPALNERRNGWLTHERF